MPYTKKQIKQLEKEAGIRSKIDCHHCNKKGILTCGDNGLFYQCPTYCEPFTTTDIDTINCLLIKQEKI